MDRTRHYSDFDGCMLSLFWRNDISVYHYIFKKLKCLLLCFFSYRRLDSLYFGSIFLDFGIHLDVNILNVILISKDE